MKSNHLNLPHSATHPSLLLTCVLICLLLLAACGGGPYSSSSEGSGSNVEPQVFEEAEEESNISSTGDEAANGSPAPAAPAGTANPAPAAEIAEAEREMHEEAAPEEEAAEALDGVSAAATAPAAAPDVALSEDDAVAGAPPVPEGGGGESDIAVLPTPAPTNNAERDSFVGAPAPLKAGEIDDNEQFSAYLDYLTTYQGAPVRTVDVSERYIIEVISNDQQPLLDARVTVYDEQDQQLFEGLTYAGGQTLFLPDTRDVSDNAQRFRIVAERNGATTETTLERGTQERVELALPGGEPPATLRLDVLFLLDTTGSMADELSRIQDTIDSISQRIDSFEPRPEVRFGLVAYRDVGDDYVTRDYDFTTDVSAFRQVLNSFDADGGGDTPEALSEGLHIAVNEVGWNDNAVRLIFLVADAGPHMDRELPYTYLSNTQQAVTQGIKIYPIAASNTEPDAEYVFRQLAQQTMGQFIFLTYQTGESQGAPGDTTELEAGEQGFTVERLDDLIVQVIERELAAAVGTAR